MARPQQKWIHLSLRLPAASAEELGVRCIELGAPGVQTDQHDLRRRASGARSVPSRLEAYFPPETDLPDLRKSLREAVAALRPVHGGPPPETVTLRRVALPDYSTSWKDHFRPLRVGRRLRIVAPWHEVPEDGRLAIRIDPGQAFGTGQHPTTRGCLLEIERILSERSATWGLDLGCGSGVLAFAMRGLGVKHVVAVDNDPAARAATEAGAALNGYGGIRIGADVARLHRRFDLIAANLFSRVLVDLAPTLEGLLASGGRLIVSGLLARQENEVRRALVKLGLRTEHRRAISGWVTLTSARPERRSR